MIRQILVLALSLSSILAISQEEWSLQRCVEHALENNLNIKQSEISVDFANLDQTQAKHARYPSLNGGASVNSNFGRAIDPVTNDFITEAFVSNGFSLNTGVVLFDGFRITNSIKKADIDRNAAELDLDQMKRDISLSVSNSYLNVLFADENLAIAISQLKDTEQQLVRINKLISAGMTPANEALNIEAQLANNEQVVITTENSKAIALLGLKQLLRLDPDVIVKVVVPENLDITTDPDVLTFKEVYETAVKNQANIQASEMRVKSAQLGKDIARSGLMPNVSIGGNIGTNYSNQGRKVDGFETVVNQVPVTFQGMTADLGFPSEQPILVKNPYFNQLDENVFYGIGMNVSIPIYNNYINKTNIERSKLNILSAETQTEQIKDQLKTTIQQAIADAKASKRKLAAANKSAEAQKASYDNASKRMDAGSINSFELITLKNNLQQAEVNAVIAKYEYVFALKVIDFYMGRPIVL